MAAKKSEVVEEVQEESSEKVQFDESIFDELTSMTDD